MFSKCEVKMVPFAESVTSSFVRFSPVALNPTVTSSPVYTWVFSVTNSDPLEILMEGAIGSFLQLANSIRPMQQAINKMDFFMMLLVLNYCFTSFPVSFPDTSLRMFSTPLKVNEPSPVKVPVMSRVSLAAFVPSMSKSRLKM